MVCCSAVNCSNSTKKGFRLFHFPSEPTRSKTWLINCRRDRWQPSPNSRICEVHFEDSQFETDRDDGKRPLRPDAVPTLFDVNNPPPRIGAHKPQPRKSAYKEYSQSRYLFVRYLAERLNMAETFSIGTDPDDEQEDQLEEGIENEDPSASRFDSSLDDDANVLRRIPRRRAIESSIEESTDNESSVHNESSVDNESSFEEDEDEYNNADNFGRAFTLTKRKWTFTEFRDHFRDNYNIDVKFCLSENTQFVKLGQKQIHKRQGVTQIPYAYCDKSFNNGLSLSIHMQSHKDEEIVVICCFERTLNLDEEPGRPKRIIKCRGLGTVIGDNVASICAHLKSGHNISNPVYEKIAEKLRQYRLLKDCSDRETRIVRIENVLEEPTLEDAARMTRRELEKQERCYRRGESSGSTGSRNRPAPNEEAPNPEVRGESSGSRKRPAPNKEAPNPKVRQVE